MAPDRTAEFPGMSVDDIDAEVEEGELILRGEKEMAEEKEGGRKVEISGS